MAMEVGEEQGQVAGELHHAGMLEAVHEQTVVGHEHVVEDGERLDVADLALGRGEVLALVAQAGQGHLLDALPVAGQREGDRVFGFGRAHEAGRQGDDLVGVGSHRVADLGATHDHAVRLDFDDAQVLVGIGLLAGAKAADALDVGLGAATDDVVLLPVAEHLLEPLVVVGAAGLVAVVGDDLESVERVDAHAALDAAADPVAEQPGHELLLEQVVFRAMDIGETVDLLTGEVRSGRADVLVLRDRGRSRTSP